MRLQNLSTYSKQNDLNKTSHLNFNIWILNNNNNILMNFMVNISYRSYESHEKWAAPASSERAHLTHWIAESSE